MARPNPKSAPRSMRHHAASPPTVSGRWLLGAIATAASFAALCAWGVLCLLFWQGSWQLLYHPTATVARTPASIGLPFDQVGFATTDTGAPQLSGWWIPAGPVARFTVLYLHGQNGNLSDTLNNLANIHAAGVNVFAFDYRGFGQSLFVHPSESHFLEDTESALQYLTATRHIDSRSIVLCGTALGANLALQVAAAHPNLAGVILESPIDNPVSAIFADPRARLVPAHLLLSDRYDMNAPATALRIPSLWIFQNSQNGNSSQAGSTQSSQVFEKVSSTKMRVWLPPSPQPDQSFTTALSRWLDDLHK